jgi:hypothetical protein
MIIGKGYFHHCPELPNAIPAAARFQGQVVPASAGLNEERGLDHFDTSSYQMQKTPGFSNLPG